MPRQIIYSYLPTSGVRTDFKRLMNAFLKVNTVRYEQFSKVWREKNMSFLCAGRHTEREAREFIEKILLIAREYFLPPFQFQVRVGGLYLLYGIYQIQPLLPKVKIRITPSQWTDIVYFQEQAAQQNHLDVVYIFNRLLQEQAFHFCYTPDEISHFANKQESDDKEVDIADDMKEEKSSIYQLFNYESMEKISYLQNQYQQLKIGLAGPNSSKPEKSLDVMHGELMEDLGVLLQTYNEKIASILKSQKSVEKETGSEEVVPDSSVNRRHKLKLQAYNQMTATSSKSTHNVVIISPTSPKKRVGSTSPKKRTNSTSPDKQANQEATVRTEADFDDDNLVLNMPVLDDSDHNSDQDYEPPTKVIIRSENLPSQSVKIPKSTLKKTIPEEQLLENIMDKSVETNCVPTLRNVTQNLGDDSRVMDVANGRKQHVKFRFPTKNVCYAGPSNEAVHEVSSNAKTSQRLKSQPRKSTVEEIIVFPPTRTQQDTTYEEGKFQKRGRPRKKNLIPPAVKCPSDNKEHRPKTQNIKKKSDSGGLSCNRMHVISPSHRNEQLHLPKKGNAKKTKIDMQQFAGNEIIVFPSKPVILKNIKSNQNNVKSKPKNDSNQMNEREQAIRETVQEEQSGVHPKGNMSQAVSKITSKYQKKPRDKAREVTVTKIVVGKKVGQPPTVQSVIVQDSNQIQRNCIIEIDDEEDSDNGGQSSGNQMINVKVGTKGDCKRKRSLEMGESTVAGKKPHCSAAISNSARGRRKSSPVSSHLQEGNINLTVNQPIKKSTTRKSISQSPRQTRAGRSQKAVLQLDPRTAQGRGGKFVEKGSGYSAAEDRDGQSHRDKDENAPKKCTQFSKGQASTLQSENPDGGMLERKKVEKKVLPFAYRFL
ncbi:unnamed protein product [Lymnaea stagnalis]|uniref:snRNA-activating protein complex subunit 1 n=1 Tax=Lymnaea stagnalis TaxID=6523 RepID=A0AAV2HQH2_LYMST